jgi:hypothetical protein
VKGIGLVLRMIRQQWKQLSLREVEERSRCSAQEKGNQSYQSSASWLDRLEREGPELTVNKLIVLAESTICHWNSCYLLYPGNPQPGLLRQLSGPNATMLLTDGPLEQQARYLIPDTLGPDQPRDETTLLSTDEGA